jgi:hypothetical protein
MKKYILFFLSCCCSYASAQEVNSIGMLMRDIPAGSFDIGSTRGGEDADEGPLHTVTITGNFKMSATEVANKQYEAFDAGHYACLPFRSISFALPKPALSITLSEILLVKILSHPAFSRPSTGPRSDQRSRLLRILSA